VAEFGTPGHSTFSSCSPIEQSCRLIYHVLDGFSSVVVDFNIRSDVRIKDIFSSVAICGVVDRPLGYTRDCRMISEQGLDMISRRTDAYHCGCWG